MDLHADDLAALLDGLGIEAAHIGGTSYGAEISMVFALKYPERTKSLIVTSAVSQVDPILQGLIGGWIAAARAKDAALFYQTVYPLTFSEAWIAANGALLNQAKERYNTIDFEAMLELLLSFSKLFITGYLAKIGAQTLVATGAWDLLNRRRYWEIFAREIPVA